MNKQEELNKIMKKQLKLICKDNIRNKNILLFQGPMGNFFNKLEKILENNNNITRLGLNYGDEWFVEKKSITKLFGLLPNNLVNTENSIDNTIETSNINEVEDSNIIKNQINKKNNYKGYKGTQEGRKKFIKIFLISKKIDTIFLMGDCRYYQSILIKIAQKNNIAVFVFEEGYFRPSYITLEQTGVNNYSTIPRKKSFFINYKDNEKINQILISNTFRNLAFESSIYFILSFLGQYKYPNYVHHRNFNPFSEFYYGVKNLYRKTIKHFSEKKLYSNLTFLYKKKYFFIPLQTHNDFQVVTHSKYNSIEDFINEILLTFSKVNNEDIILVFKHHPIDRGRKNYTKHIMKMKKKYGLKNKIEICFDIKLSRLLKNAKGTIVINSTVGMESLKYNTPTICLGKSLYDLEGLTNQGNLKSFFETPGEVNQILFKKFQNYLIKNTQINGSFY